MGMAEEKLNRMYAELSSLIDEAGLTVKRVENGIEISNGSQSRIFDGINEGTSYVLGFLDCLFK